MAALLNPSLATPDPAARVLKAAEYANLVEAGEILSQARERARELLEKAGIEADELRKKGHEEGFQEGKAEVAEQLFEAMTASVEQLAAMEKSLVEVAVRSVRVILGSFDREDLAVQAVGHALRLVRDEKRVLLRVAAADADTVRRRLEEITLRYPGMGRVDVASDASLSPGGCVMETDVGVIDATLDRQLSIIEDTFRRHLEERRS
ncbi:MAG: HrpE/YscL family type III secretion apparatus protein [Planctomycetota bacterium]|jgi:type III secretion protein L|nr:HrpE/YscL family type III secretion apparatus protein [Planctomycetota bacterium]